MICDRDEEDKLSIKKYEIKSAFLFLEAGSKVKERDRKLICALFNDDSGTFYILYFPYKVQIDN